MAQKLPGLMRIFLLLLFKKEGLALLFLSASPALAQTTLNLSATGQVMVPPDQIAASLTAQDNSYNAATAQNVVNAAMAQALKLASGVAGLKAVTESESVSSVTPDGGGRIQYQASQQLDLTMDAPAGAPPAALSALLGTLQDKGFLLQNFDGELSDRAQETGEQAAIAEAIRLIKAQARAVAAPLGESVGRFETINLNMPEGGPGPVAFAAAAPGPMMARAFTAPSASPSNIQVTATVTAVVDLAPAH